MSREVGTRIAPGVTIASNGVRVRYRDESGKLRQRTFATQSAALAFRRTIDDLRAGGEIAILSAGKKTLLEVGQEFFRRRMATQEPSTVTRNATTWDIWVLPYAQHVAIERISVGLIEDMLIAMRSDGASVGTTRRALAILRRVLKACVAWGYLRSNPADLVDMPRSEAPNPITAISPAAVETMCAYHLAKGRHRDALLFRVMAYAGVRPIEAFNLRICDLQKNTLLVRAPKTKTFGTVDLFEPLAVDLREWVMRMDRPEPNALLFTRTHVPGDWSKYDRDNWRNRCFDPAAIAAGFCEERERKRGGETKTHLVSTITPYTLRHSFASLLIHAGRPVTYVAKQMRHSVEMLVRNYAHLIDDVDHTAVVDPEALILEAREQVNSLTIRSV